MPRRLRRAFVMILLGAGFSSRAYVQKALNWSEVLDLFRKNNPAWPRVGSGAGISGRRDHREAQAQPGILDRGRPVPGFIQLNYRNLIGSYLSAANQLNLAVGREVLP